MTDVKKLITEHLDIWLTAETEKKSGRGRSSSSSNSIYGVQKLRELILDLAIQGKLVKQDGNDIPASELLKNIKIEQENLIKNKIIRKPKPLPPLARTSSNKGWITCYLLDIGDWGAGATPPRANSSLYGGTIPWFKSGELSSDYINSSEESVTPLALEKCSLRLNKPNDVLIAMYGATIGKTAITTVECTTNQAVCACTLFGEFSSKFLLTFLKAKKQYFIDMGAGGAQPNISREKLIETIIEVPPLEEQQRIVAKVDELMQLCDQLEQQQNLSSEAHDQLVDTLLSVLTNSSDADEFQQNWHHISENFDLLFTTEYSVEQLKQTILQLAVMGKLVKQDPNDEPASQLLKQITEEKARLVKEGKIKKAKPLPEINDEEMPFELPIGWSFQRLQNVLDIRDGTHDSPKDYKGEDFKYLVTSKNFKDDEIDFTTARKISFGDYQEIIKRSYVEKDDILFSMIGGNIGNQVMVKDTCDFAIKNVALFKYYKKESTLPYFVKIYTNFLSLHLQKKALGGAQPFIGLSTFRSLIIGLPPVNEQKRIVDKVNQLFSVIDKLQILQGKLQRTKLLLADSLIANALSSAKNKNENEAIDNIIQFEKPIDAIKQRKQKSADQIDLFTDESVDDDLKLLSLAAEITFQLHTEPTFGHLKLQKLIYLCQQLKHMDLVADFKQHAAGPYDPVMARYLDKEFKDREWFSYDPKRDLKYKPLSRCNDHRSAFSKYFAKDVSEIYDLIGLFRTSKSDHIEIVATLFACWLRLLEKKSSVTEEQLLKDFYAWSKEKKEFSQNEVLNGLKWMKLNSVVPL
ncbi:restriction endonuclease subunit S [Acinetobacter bereziniae]|uniref:restriction endonuclease subunit S n=1 Tax=Acinetobacter bereziniae TaxID=106648 RepID=UPI0021E412C0|nr:restriction endonuclease subunit S [Acinetobacter bereziniae]MCV2441785.1 restriction endonuclease subunit S [Acinetobacter bereziniae]